VSFDASHEWFAKAQNKNANCFIFPDSLQRRLRSVTFCGFGFSSYNFYFYQFYTYVNSRSLYCRSAGGSRGKEKCPTPCKREGKLSWV